jgi:hypothetical protein
MSRNLRNLIPLGSVIAERELTFERQNEKPRIIRVQVGAPVPDPDGRGSALCPMLVSGFDREERLTMGGVDTMQALILGLAALREFLALCARQYGGALSWLGTDDLGFAGRSQG